MAGETTLAAVGVVVVVPLVVGVPVDVDAAGPVAAAVGESAVGWAARAAMFVVVLGLGAPGAAGGWTDGGMAGETTLAAVGVVEVVPLVVGVPVDVDAAGPVTVAVAVVAAPGEAGGWADRWTFASAEPTGDAAGRVVTEDVVAVEGAAPGAAGG
jgi:hypothetical protein